MSLTALWPDPLPSGTQGVPYSYTLTASGGTAPYTYSIASGSLPAGLSLDPTTGIISGTPSTSVSLAAVTFAVTDSTSGTAAITEGAGSVVASGSVVQALATITSCGRLDAYDNLNGSIILAWNPFIGGTPDSFNLYVNGVFYANVGGSVNPSGLQLQNSLGVLLLENGGRLLLEISINSLNAFFSTISGLTQTSYSPGTIPPAPPVYNPTILPGGIQLENGSGDLLLETGGYLLSENTIPQPTTGGVYPGSTRPQSMPPVGLVTQSGTYLFNVVAVLGGNEVATSNYKRLTVNPASIMLVTPMRRPFPFPQTSID